MNASTITPIETRQIDGIWWATWNHTEIGYCDARASTENMAIHKCTIEIRRAREQYIDTRYLKIKNTLAKKINARDMQKGEAA